MSRIETAQVFQFVGGPSDGLMVRDPQFHAPGVLRIPSVAALNEHCNDVPDCEWITTYVLVRQECRMEDSEMMSCLRYEFRGYERFELPVQRDVAQRNTSGSWKRLHRWCSEFGRKLATWMLEPIDYPLKTYGSGADRNPCE